MKTSLRSALAFAFCLIALGLAMLSFVANPSSGMTGSSGNSPSGPIVEDKYAGSLSRSAPTSASMPGPGWSVVISPNNGTHANVLQAVACASASDCWAVGSYDNGSHAQTLIEHWNGTSWAIVSSPNTSAMQDNLLNAATCTSGSECWAVGYYYAIGQNIPPQTLIEHWNGTSWSIVVNSPNTSATQSNYLNAVTCTSGSECWAAGYYNNGSVNQTLVEQWNGASWSIVNSPNNNNPAHDNVLNAVTCTSASECWAAGDYNNGSVSAPVSQTLIEQWNGTSWAIVTSPNSSATQNNVLNGVTCDSASNCWAAGDYVDGSGHARTLIERWNGTSWLVYISPNIDKQGGELSNNLLALACASASECWAVGYYFDIGSPAVVHTLIEVWNSSTWSIVILPSNPQEALYLYGVTCASASECWAVGTYVNGSSLYQTLIEEYTPPELKFTSITRLANGQISLGGVCVANSPNTIQASPDLVSPFTRITTVSCSLNGFFGYTDTDAGSFTKRFYEISYP